MNNNCSECGVLVRINEGYAYILKRGFIPGLYHVRCAPTVAPNAICRCGKRAPHTSLWLAVIVSNGSFIQRDPVCSSECAKYSMRFDYRPYWPCHVCGRKAVPIECSCKKTAYCSAACKIRDRPFHEKDCKTTA